MSLFVDLRQLKSSVSNISDMVDKMTSTMGKNPSEESKKFEGTTLYGSSIFKPPLGFGVRFSQSQEDVCQNLPSSRLRSHMSLPNLGKDSSFDKSTNIKKDSQPKIVEIDDENSKSILHISTEKLNDLIVASKIKRPHFDDSGDTHPMDFLEDVRYYISEFNLSKEKQLSFVMSCLDGVPLMWARCFKSEFRDIDDFYDAFEQEFWGKDRQKTVLYDMKLGKYDEVAQRISMSEYFLHKVSNYRHLTPPPSDLEIVYSLAAHFPSAVELELRLSQKPSLREAYRVLRRREGEGVDFLPNYLYEMCEAYQRGHRPESARRRDCAETQPTTCSEH